MKNRSVLPDLADLADVIAERGIGLGKPLHLSRTTGSTNDDAKDGAREGAPHGALWVSEQQEEGRGRQGRTWHAEPGEALLFSVLVRVRCPVARLPPLALVAGLAVRDVVARLVPDRVTEVKWPNDVLVGGKKVAGVLLETAGSRGGQHALVVGIGLNVLTRSFPDELAPVATSLALEGGQEETRANILADILVQLDRDLFLAAHRGLGLFHERLAKVDALLGRPVIRDGERGVGAGIDSEGCLLVQRPDGSQARWAAGDVVLLD